MSQFFVMLSLLAGGLLAVQAGANAQLAKAVGSPFGATALQLLVGALLLSCVAVAGDGRRPWTLLPGAVWWHLLAGVASAVYVVSTILLFPRIGAVVSVGLVIAGQMLASSALDAFGLLGVPVAGFGPGLALGAILVIVGAGLIVTGQSAASAVGQPGPAWILLAVFAGAVLPIQGAVNALLRQELGGAAFVVGTISFVVATLAMGIVLCVMIGWFGAVRPNFAGLGAMPWWGWLGGFAGATYVTTVFTAIPAIGAATTVGLTVAGQQIASILVDANGWFRLPRRPVTLKRLTGVALLLVGAVVIKAF